MEKKHYISAIVPALNEEGNLENTVMDIKKNLMPYTSKMEIIVVDDGSTDKTRQIAERLLSEEKIQQVIHHVRPYGIGFSFRDGVFKSGGEFVVMIPGDNEMDVAELKKALPYLNENDFVLPYTVNKNVRNRFRRTLSKTYNFLINALFGINIKYSNGCVIYKRDIFNHLNVVTDGFTFQAEIVLKAIRLGYRHKEIGVNIRQRSLGKSKALRLRTFYDIFWNLLIILIEIYLLRKYSYKVKDITYE